MAKPANYLELNVTLSILDRLTDLDPKSPTVMEAPLTRAESVRRVKAGLRRDLEWLLNTRRIAVPCDPALEELTRSVYSFGLPDFSNYSLASPKDEAKLVRSLQEVVKLFEPRLTNVKVIPVEIGASGTRTIRMRLEGLLLIDPAPEQVSFDTTLQLVSGNFKINGDADAG
jgi:type VI secretion system protein ImpF